MTASTGPKISSCAIVARGSTSAKMVGSTYQPRSSPAGARRLLSGGPVRLACRGSPRQAAPFPSDTTSSPAVIRIVTAGRSSPAVDGRTHQIGPGHARRAAPPDPTVQLGILCVAVRADAIERGRRHRVERGEKRDIDSSRDQPNCIERGGPTPVLGRPVGCLRSGYKGLRPWKVRRRSLIQAPGFSQGMKWPPWSWALTLTWLNQSDCGLVLNARTRSSAVRMPGGFS
jgi:hypothetical protein